MTELGCPFCERLRAQDELLAQSVLCAAFFDTTPLNPGHALVVPTRHEPDFLALSTDEQVAIVIMATELRRSFEQTFQPDGFNIGVNIGAMAGQTIDHAHLHLIPRYRGDVTDPRGGVRWIIPERAKYWET